MFVNINSLFGIRIKGLGAISLGEEITDHLNVSSIWGTRGSQFTSCLANGVLLSEVASHCW